MTDPSLRDSLINELCLFHEPAVCQDVPCQWCAAAALRADAALNRFAEWLVEAGWSEAAVDLREEAESERRTPVWGVLGRRPQRVPGLAVRLWVPRLG